MPHPAPDTWPPPPAHQAPATYADRYLEQLDRSFSLWRALIKAERFIAGFEDDPDQVGVPELLAQIRAAVEDAAAPPSPFSQPPRKRRRPFNGPALLAALVFLAPFMAGAAGFLLWIHAR